MKIILFCLLLFIIISIVNSFYSFKYNIILSSIKLKSSKHFIPSKGSDSYNWYRVYVESGREQETVDSFNKAAANPNHIFYGAIFQAEHLLKPRLKSFKRKKIKNEVNIVESNKNEDNNNNSKIEENNIENNFILNKVEIETKPISPSLIYLKMISSPKLFLFLEKKVDVIRRIMKQIKSDQYLTLSKQEENDLLQTLKICNKNKIEKEILVNQLYILNDINCFEQYSAPFLFSQLIKHPVNNTISKSNSTLDESFSIDSTSFYLNDNSQNFTSNGLTCFVKVKKKNHVLYRHVEDKIGVIVDIKKKMFQAMFPGMNGYFSCLVALDAIEPYYPSQVEINSWTRKALEYNSRF